MQKIKFVALLFLLLCASTLFAQKIRVTGVVTDAGTSEPIIGAIIGVTGTGTGSITDIDGKYGVDAPTDGELEFRLIGYIPMKIKVDGQTEINIQLEEDIIGLEEVIVLGYGQEARKANLSVAVAQKQIGESIKSRPGGVVSSLQGQVAGVTISSVGGDPSSGRSVVIRGQGSRSGESPLYVVDGVSGATFNEEDVESITVLKDAASAAIYGTNVGSGGVILVTTKQAKAGKTKVTARASYGIQNVWRKPEALNAEEYVRVRTDAARLSGSAVPGGINPEIYPYGQVTRTDWIDEIFRTGSIQNYAMTLTGGTDNMKAHASVEYKSTEGTMLRTFRRDFGARLNVDFKLTDWMSLTQNVHFKNTTQQGGINTESHIGVTASALFMPPSATVYEYDREGNPVYNKLGQHQYGGTIPQWASGLGVGGTFGEVQNPVATLNRLNQNRPNQDLYSTTTLNVRPLDVLKLTSSLTAITFNGRNSRFFPIVPEIGKPKLQNSRSIETWRTNKILWESVAAYDQHFGKHSVGLMGGFSLNSEDYSQNFLEVYDFPNEDDHSQNLGNGTDWTKTKPTEAREQQRQVSLFTRAAYTFDDRYFVTASIRRDATSRLYTKERSGVFTAVSGGWNISNESFFNVDWISLLKVRASWGQIGNVGSVPKYSFASSLSGNNEPIYLGKDKGNQLNGLGVAGMVNRQLTWEKSEQTDIGFDLELLGGRLSMGADYFSKTTKDLIEELPPPSVAGIETSPYYNIGEVNNKGVELSIGYADKTASGFSYSFSGNVTRLKSEVKDLGGDREFLYHGNTIRGKQPLRSEAGQPWYSYYLIETDGIFKTQAEVDAHVFTDENGNKKLIQPNAQVGDLKFIDHNGDGIINSEDSKYMGSYTPKWTYGFTAAFAYKGFDLNLTLQGIGGNRIFNGQRLMTSEVGQGWNMNRDMINSWTYNQNSGVPLVTFKDSNGNFGTMSDYYLESGSYLRMKNITLGYTIPKKVFKNVLDIRAYVSGENLFTITPYSGMDPEVGGSGIDGGRYPSPRTVTVGVNVAF